ncbi:MAG: hypothetical protein LBK53_01120 [Heliobacteriaceae bacterium]|jgi:acetyltransferase-like isoleucine patch superfamily enzyme|nr:hypothetical protein [Heliobacteriaceae bacterium]
MFKINILGIKISWNYKKRKDSEVIVVKTNGKEIKKRVKGLEVKHRGKGSVIKVYEPLPGFERCSVEHGDNYEVVFGSSAYPIRDLHVFLNESNNCKINIGKDFSCGSMRLNMQGCNGTEINIGEDCLFSWGINISCTDHHVITDAKTGLPLNKNGSVAIGNHCWLCLDVTVNKNSEIPHYTIVGCKSVVCGKFKKTNTILGGIPARVVKDENTSWEHPAYEAYIKQLT